MAGRLIIGLMSGTSVDAIDAALVRVSPGTGGRRYRAQVLAHAARPWPSATRRRLLAVMAPATTQTQEICELHALVARESAAAVLALLKAHGIPAARIAAIASHGQTICHLPLASNTRHPILKFGSTLQIGDVAMLATLTGIPVVGNFRSADIAVGGQGAPLVPWADDVMLSHETLTRCVQNIGGIANVTFLPALARRPRGPRADPGILAFDTGPGNMLIDALMTLGTAAKAPFDRNGRTAARGTVNLPLLSHLQAHPYFRRHPPKSTGREDFGIPLARRLFARARTRRIPFENLIHTATRLTACSIAEAYRRFLPRPPEEIILCGGGAANPVLVRMLEAELPVARFRVIDELGIPNKAKEAASFALLAAATLDGVPSNLPAATGARQGVILGEIANPRLQQHP